MNDELDQFLDGEASRDDVSGALQAEVEAWDRLVESLRRDVPGPAPAWLEEAVMSRVRTVDGPGAAPNRHWILRRHTIRVSPLAMGLAAAAVLALAVGPWIRSPSDGAIPGEGPGAASLGGADPVVYVQFVLEAPGASSVAVSGDFNEWDRSVHTLDDPDGDGVWTGRVPIRPGIHEYMFVIDGERWVTDPRADRYADDGFGNRNAVLAVSGPGRT